MNLKQELQQLHVKLDKTRRKLAAAEKRLDLQVATQSKREITALNKQIQSMKTEQASQLSSQVEKVKAMAFSRTLTKQEQADMGKLKKKVKGLIVIHPLTAQGREMGVTEVTGYARKEF